MKFRGKITDIGCIQHFTRKYDVTCQPSGPSTRYTFNSSTVNIGRLAVTVDSHLRLSLGSVRQLISTKHTKAITVRHCIQWYQLRFTGPHPICAELSKISLMCVAVNVVNKFR